MTVRSLPELHRPDAPEGVEFAIHPQARASFDASVIAAAKDSDTISILSEIGENWDGTGVTPNRIAAALRSIGEKPVTVQINSPGGNFFDGLAIYNMLRAHKHPITVQVLGIAASAASMIAMAGDEIQIGKAGIMMIHNSQWIALGDRHVMTETARSMAVFDDAMAGLYSDRSGVHRDEVSAMMDATTFMSGEEAVDQGFADALLPADAIEHDTKAEMSALRQIDTALAQGKRLPRAKRRELISEITGTPSAAADNDMPGAVEAVVVDDNSGLSVALARLKLTRA